MFEDAELDHRLDPAAWKQEQERLRTALLDAQYDLSQQKKCALLIVIGGVEGAGKGETVNLLHEWMDPRHLLATAFGQPSDEERQRPPMWRFWRALPPRGRIGIFFGAWHTLPILDRADGKIDEAEFDRRIASIREFERMLTDEGVALVKLWFYLSKKQQKRRFRELRADKRTAWRVSDRDRLLLANHARLARASERLLRATSTGRAPWYVVPGADPAYRAKMVGRILLETLRERLDATPPAAPTDRTPPLPPSIDGRTVLSELNLERSVPKKSYAAELEKWQGRLARLTRKKSFREAVAGGGVRGAGRRRQGRRHPARHAGPRRPLLPWHPDRGTDRGGARAALPVALLAPPAGAAARSRSSTAPGTGACWSSGSRASAREDDWMRAYAEINDFEEQLVEHGIVVVQVLAARSTKDEQLRRFQEREQTAFKRFKITAGGLAQPREVGAPTSAAVRDMVERTSTEIAPWTLVEANDKRYRPGQGAAHAVRGARGSRLAWRFVRAW